MKIGHDMNHPFREKTLWEPGIEEFGKRFGSEPNCGYHTRCTAEVSQVVRNMGLRAPLERNRARMVDSNQPKLVSLVWKHDDFQPRIELNSPAADRPKQRSRLGICTVSRPFPVALPNSVL